jgi:hypothetical protein
MTAMLKIIFEMLCEITDKTKPWLLYNSHNFLAENIDIYQNLINKVGIFRGIVKLTPD